MSEDEEKQESTVSEDESSTEVAIEGEQEAKAEEAPPEEKEEEQPKEEEEEKAEEEKPEGIPPDLQAFIDQTLKEREQESERLKEQAAERKSLEEAIQAYEDGDPAPLAQRAAELYKAAQEADKVSAQAEESAQQLLRPYVEAVYGEQIRALKPDEVKELSEMSIVDALQELDRRRVESIRGESASEVSAAQKAAQNAATGAKAREEGGGVLPKGSAEEGVSDDIGTLIREELESGLDVEEAVGG